MAQFCDAGIIGSSRFIRETALALSRKGFPIAALNAADGGSQRATSLKEFVALLRYPRVILVGNESDEEVDTAINELIPHLGQGDIIVDCSPSPFKQTAARSRRLADRALHLLAIGTNAWTNHTLPCAILMAGGQRDIYARTCPLWEAWATQVDGQPCVQHFGTAAAAHFLAMVHRAIDLGLMELLRECLEIARRLTDFGPASAPPAHLHLETYIGDLLGKFSAESQLHERLTAAKGSSFARCFAQTRRELGTPTPIMEVALGAQTGSADDRREAFLTTAYRRPLGRFGNDAASLDAELDAAFQAAMIITYAEGMALIAAASERFAFHLNSSEVARVWRGACTLRGPLLENIAEAMRLTPGLPNLLFDDDLSEQVMAAQESLRHAVWRAAEMGLQTPALLSALDYLDSHREAWFPVNLIQPFARDRRSLLEEDDDSSEWTFDRISGIPRGM